MVIGLFVDQEVSVGFPASRGTGTGLRTGGVDFEIGHAPSVPFIGIKIPLTLRIDADSPSAESRQHHQPDPSENARYFIGTIPGRIDTDGNLTFDVPGTVSIPPCMIGNSG